MPDEKPDLMHTLERYESNEVRSHEVARELQMLSWKPHNLRS